MKTPDGVWLFREDDTNWWRLTFVRNGLATADWIHGSIAVERLEGEWREPTQREELMAADDCMGRLRAK